ncbi:MAG TPA: hypothetical protein VFW33_08610 [Gemmataceae bacterium]|nr:hypothetical protein [Gemmataceae bacterium]
MLFDLCVPPLALLLYVAWSAWREHRAAAEAERFYGRHGLVRRR